MIARPDEEFELLLADLDRKVAEGSGLVDSTIAGNAELSDRLDLALDCLQTLERIWPRAESASPLATPRTLGRFRLIRELGRGGFGIVYLAEDPQLGRDVALKVQRPEAMLSPTLRNRFVREAHSAAALKHPHIVTVFDSGEDGLWCWIASERISGPSLSAYLAEHPLPSIGEACRLVLAMADALAHSHAQGILHRDLKPGNVLLEPRGDQPVGLDDYLPKLTDFSLAKLLEDESSETRTGARLGTPAYMAPEQVEGRKGDIGPATDVYGLGVLLYQLLAGQTPFVGETESEILKGVLLRDPPPLRKVRKEIPRDLEAIVLKALEKPPAKRYPSAAGLAADLRRLLSFEPTEARPLNLAQRITKRVRRHPAICIAVVLGLTALSLLWIASDLSRKNRKLIGYRTVSLATNPSGAKVVFAPIDPHTGEPIENEIISASTLSPVEETLLPGDYLIVAVLPDGRFHEVFRHIPREGEVARQYRQHLWQTKKDGRVELFEVVIPEKSATDGMVLIEDPATPKNRKSEAFAPFYLGAFEVKYSEVHNQRPDIQAANGSQDGFDYAAEVGYDQAVWYAEKRGWRLPSQIEYEIAVARCLDPADVPASKAPRIAGFGPVGVPENDVTNTVPPIVGLRSNVAEWTTSRDGRTAELPEELRNHPYYNETRVIRGGNKRIIETRSVHSTDIRLQDEPRARMRFQDVAGVGFRCARSARPRFVDAPAGR